MLIELHGVEDLLPEGESCDGTSAEESDEENAQTYWLKPDPYGHYLAEWRAGQIA